MNVSRFFIDRPIFAAVLSIVIFVAGLLALPLLPVAEYPDVVPPSVVVRAVYPGANPKVIADTVATPLEEAISGVEGMIYMRSVASSNGVLTTTVTFRPGTDPDAAAVRVQNRVAQAQARLPEDVRRQGVTTEKRSPVFLMVVHLVSPKGTYDSLYLRNYARLHVRDALARGRFLADELHHRVRRSAELEQHAPEIVTGLGEIGPELHGPRVSRQGLEAVEGQFGRRVEAGDLIQVLDAGQVDVEGVSLK